MKRRDFLSMGALAPVLWSAASVPAAAAADSSGEVKTGGSRMVEIAGGHKVWTKRVGHGPLKVLLLHGGPGFSHDYLECFEDFMPAGVEFYYYDQLGCGNSDKPADTALWTLPRYLEEVEQVRAGLGLEDFVLYGHSWGGMLGYEYALKYGRHLRGLVVSNMTAGVPAYVEHMKVLRAALSPADQATLARYEQTRRYDAPEYQKIIFEQLYAQHLLRLPEWPEPVARTFGKVNTAIYNLMQGDNEFVITGNFKDWDRWADLHRIATPTLIMGARYDEMDPEQMRRAASLIPGARLFLSERGSHLTMYDDQAAYFAALTGFLRGLQA